MSQAAVNTLPIPSKQQAHHAVKENPDYANEKQIRSIVNQSLAQLTAIENRLDKLENKGAIRRVFDIMTGTTQREMITLMRDLAQTQQTTIQLVLTLAVYHAQNVAVMDDILQELTQAKGAHVRTASHIEFLFNQVQLIRDRHIEQQRQTKNVSGGWIAAGVIACIAIVGYAVYLLLGK